MNLFGLIDHMLNFLTPALVVGGLLAVSAPIFMKKTAPAHSWYAQAAINFVAGASALGIGLWYFGHDGKMASYAAMVLAMATSQWCAGRR